MTEKSELTAQEAEAWTAFRSEAYRLSLERMELPIANEEGWSVKDVLYHIGHWWTDLADMIAVVNDGGEFVEPPDDDEATNAENLRVLEESRSLSIEDVISGVANARARLLALWLEVPNVDEALRRWFVWETIEHYEEHLPDVRRVAEADRSR
jgi:hypothetical protein